MADPFADLATNPIRPGAAPQLPMPTSGPLSRSPLDNQPVYKLVTDVLLYVLRNHFGTQSYIEHLELIDRVYTPSDRESSPIQISSLAEWKPTTASQRPVLLVDRLDQERDLANRAIGDQFQGLRPGFFEFFMHGQHVVHCIGGREGEAEVLSHEVWRELTRFGPTIAAIACLKRFLAVKVGKRVKLEEARETYSVPIVCTYGYSESWRLRPVDEQEVNAIVSYFMTSTPVG